MTGDVGPHGRSEGYVTLRDRSKDMIISGGSNIYPREVEEVLLEHPAWHEVSRGWARAPEWGEVRGGLRRDGRCGAAQDLDQRLSMRIA